MCVQLFCIGKSRFHFLGGEKKDLKSDLKQLMFPGNENDPVAMCEDAGKFSMAMFVFQSYEHTVRICMYTYESTTSIQRCTHA